MSDADLILYWRKRAEEAEGKLCAARDIEGLARVTARDGSCDKLAKEVHRYIFGPSDGSLTGIRASLSSSSPCRHAAALESAQTELRGANYLIASIEKLFPNWKDFRDLDDCIRCELNERDRMREGWHAATNELMALAYSKPHDISIFDEAGKEYIIRWDNGDESVGIRAGWVSEDLDAVFDARDALLSRLNDTETQGRIMHESWTRTKRAQGFHHPAEEHGPGFNKQIHGKWCYKCHSDLIPWKQLPEAQKDINRHAFDDVIAHLRGGKG
jgi:hypothetical protein